MKYDDTKYIEAVKKCTLLVKQRNELKYEIVKIALSVCFIKKGNNTSIRHYSLSAFAKDIGIPIGTLSRCEAVHIVPLSQSISRRTLPLLTRTRAKSRPTTNTPRLLATTIGCLTLPSAGSRCAPSPRRAS